MGHRPRSDAAGGLLAARRRAAHRALATLALIGVLAAGCMFRSTNSVTVINNSTVDLTVATESGDQGPKPLPHNHDVIFIVQRDGCMDDTLVAVDDAGRVRTRNERPCGGDLWAIYERELESDPL